MKKIIAAFDGLKYSTATQDHAIAFAKKNDGFLVGVFLDDLFYHSYSIYDVFAEEGGGLETKRKHLESKDVKHRARSVETFENACEAAGIKYSVHKDRKAAIRELIKESIYADMLVIDRHESFTRKNRETPTLFIQQLLPQVQCPVLVVAGSYKPITQSVLLFDGSPTAMYAFKMLANTLHQVTGLPADVFTVLTAGKGPHLPDSFLIREFMQRHFSKVTYNNVKGKPESQIVSYLKNKSPGTLVVLGAYQRSNLSRVFRQSMAETLMEKTDLTLFIAHSI
jgi:hypothetical protein